MARPTKKLDELECAKFFTNRLNKRYSFDYEAEPNENEVQENEFVDIYVHSTSRKYPPLNLQITTKEGVLYRDFARLRDIARKTGQNVVMGDVKDMATEKWVRLAIQTKEKKYTLSIQHKLVLIVWGEFGALFDEEYARSIFADLKDTGFKGIYFVRLPDSLKNSGHPHDGQVIAIKDINNNHGRSF